MGQRIKELNGQIVGSNICNTGGEATAEVGSQYQELVTELTENIGSREKWPGKGRRGPKGPSVTDTRQESIS